MKKVTLLFGNFFALLSTLNVSGILKGGLVYEPIPPNLREENDPLEKK